MNPKELKFLDEVERYFGNLILKSGLDYDSEEYQVWIKLQKLVIKLTSEVT